jgi:hypothetical protein
LESTQLRSSSYEHCRATTIHACLRDISITVPLLWHNTTTLRGKGHSGLHSFREVLPLKALSLETHSQVVPTISLIFWLTSTATYLLLIAGSIPFLFCARLLPFFSNIDPSRCVRHRTTLCLVWIFDRPVRCSVRDSRLFLSGRFLCFSVIDHWRLGLSGCKMASSNCQPDSLFSRFLRTDVTMHYHSAIVLRKLHTKLLRVPIYACLLLTKRCVESNSRHVRSKHDPLVKDDTNKLEVLSKID